MKITGFNEDYGLTDEFRNLIIEYANQTTVRQAAERFNVGQTTIYVWKKAIREYNGNNIVKFARVRSGY